MFKFLLKFPSIWWPYSNSLWCCVSQVKSWRYAGNSNSTGTNTTNLLSPRNVQGWATLHYTPTIIYIGIYMLPETYFVFILASRGAQPQHILNSYWNFLLYDYHIIIHFDAAFRRSKVDGTLGVATLLVLILLTYCPFMAIKVELRYVALHQQ